MITKTFKLTIATDTEEQMQKEEEYLSMIYGAEEIEALEQQPCEDVISRQAAINALWKALYEYEDKTEKQFLESEELDVADWFQHRIFVQNMSDIDRQTILNLPSAQPERKKGRWMSHYDYCKKHELLPSGLVAMWWCDICGQGVEHPTNFCPNCGAKMKEAEE